MDFNRPTYLLDPVKCRKNIRVMAQKAKNSGVIFRPHFKTHQSQMIGGWFRDEGVGSITVSSLAMADFFANCGWNDITVAFPVNLREISLINRLAGEIRLGLLVEDIEVARELEYGLSEGVRLWVKIDSGAGRTGLTIDEMAAIRDIIHFLNQSDKFHFAGLLTHAGHTYRASGRTEILKIGSDSIRYMNRIKDGVMDLVEDCPVSIGDTPSCSLLDSFRDVDEIRPGNFVFYDLMQLSAEACTFDQIAAVMVCPVVSVHEKRNQAVIYGGAVHFSKDFILVNQKPVYGQLVELDDTGWHEPFDGAFLVALSQEHGIVQAPSELIKKIKPGQLVGILPVHACLTANLMRGYRLISGELIDHFSGI